MSSSGTLQSKSAGRWTRNPLQRRSDHTGDVTAPSQISTTKQGSIYPRSSYDLALKIFEKQCVDEGLRDQALRKDSSKAQNIGKAQKSRLRQAGQPVRGKKRDRHHVAYLLSVIYAPHNPDTSAGLAVFSI